MKNVYENFFNHIIGVIKFLVGKRAKIDNLNTFSFISIIYVGRYVIMLLLRFGYCVSKWKT